MPESAGGAGRERCKCAAQMWQEQIKQERSRQNMRRRGYAGLVLAAAVFAAAGTGNVTALAGQAAASGPAAESRPGDLSRAEKTGTGETALAEYLPEGFDVNQLTAAEQTDHLILAVGDGADQSSLTLWYYERGEDGRLSEVFGTRGTCGRAGITADKVEGDKKTPSGLYSFTMAFGLKEDPGSQIPYRQVQDGDCFVDDVGSRYYNQYVKAGEVQADWRSAEVLKNQGPCYNYALVLNYNADCVPGRGSAIFLHCPKVKDDTYTAGCIGIPEELVKTILITAGRDAKILIVQDREALGPYMAEGQK